MSTYHCIDIVKFLECIPLAQNLGTTGKSKSTQCTLTESTSAAKHSLPYGKGERYKIPYGLTRLEFVHPPSHFTVDGSYWKGEGLTLCGK